SSIIPDASIPGVCGYFLVIPLLPDADIASLKFNAEYWTLISNSPGGRSSRSISIIFLSNEPDAVSVTRSALNRIYSVFYFNDVLLLAIKWLDRVKSI